MDKDYAFLSLEVPEGCPSVTIVRLNRPLKLNAIHGEMWREIGHVFGCLGRGSPGDADSRSVLLTGNGRGFCSGIDISDLSLTGSHHCNDPARTGIAMMSKIQQMQACFTQLEACPIPVVVAMHGVCMGAGIDLACCADIRICASDTVFSVREVQLGLAADVGTLQRLPKITGNASWVSHMCLTGRNFKAAEALQMGFVSQIVHGNADALLKQGVQLCQSIALHSPVAVLGTKKALLYSRDHSVADSLDQIIAFNALALQSDDLTQAIQAATEKRQPTFSSLLRQSRL
jgi:Delta3,5-Delta2,4-dienoyl-CoA isomerase